MKDISHKTPTLRIAHARATLKANPELLDKIRKNEIPKGDPLPVAKVAAIQAAKSTDRIIPYCHPIPVDHVQVDFELGLDSIEIDIKVKAIYKTGVEMEALTAASVAALTIYDMLKVFDQSMEISSVRLIEKKGGKSDFVHDNLRRIKAAVLVVSDTVSAGKKQDSSGKLIVERLEQFELTVAQYKVVADDEIAIEECIKDFADRDKFDIVVTTGGTGLGPRDRTPEVIKRLIDMDVPGISETLRAYGQERMPLAMLSRGLAGVRGKTLIIALPGSSRAVGESMDAIFPAAFHTISILSGAEHSEQKHGRHEHAKH